MKLAGRKGPWPGKAKACRGETATPDQGDALRSLYRILVAVCRDGPPAARPAGVRARLGAVRRAAIRAVPGIRAAALRTALERLAGSAAARQAVPGIDAALLRSALDWLAGSAMAEHRDIAEALSAALLAEDWETARAIATTGLRTPDLRAEKIVSHRHGFLWICNPKVASRSIIQALLSADPGAELLVGRSLEKIFTTHPEVKDYYSFAFIRHPCRRVFSFWADKHVKLARCPEADRYFIKPYYGVRKSMAFAELCRWLNTPYGSDAFADRHWLSQHRQIRLPDGRLPDFIGRYERLDADWETVTARLGLPARALPRFNVRPEGMTVEDHLDGKTTALLRRRYAGDFRLGGYGRLGRSFRTGGAS